MKNANIGKIKLVIFALVSMFCTAANAQQTLYMHAHRGEPTIAPQNTAEGIKLAFELGARMIETDFRLTKDGTMLCMHAQKDLESVWGIDKKIEDMTLDDILSSKLANPEKFDKKYANCRIPTIDEVFAAIPKDKFAEIEIKSYGKTFADKIDAARKKAGLSTKNLIITSFHDSFIKAFKAKYPEYETQLVCIMPRKKGVPNPTPEEIMKRLKDAGASQVAIGNYKAIDAAYVKKIKDAGYMVGVWQVNTVSELLYAIELGVDRICSDRASAIRKEYELIKNTNLK